MCSAPVAIFFKLYFALNFFTIFATPVSSTFALAAI